MTLKTLIELQEKATPGPWQAEDSDITYPADNYDLLAQTFSPVDQHYSAENNAAFIAAARNFDFAALDRRMREMEEALRFYADNDKNTRDHVYGRKVPLGWEYDEGEKARKALGS